MVSRAGQLDFDGSLINGRLAHLLSKKVWIPVVYKIIPESLRFEIVSAKARSKLCYFKFYISFTSLDVSQKKNNTANKILILIKMLLVGKVGKLPYIYLPEYPLICF